jgi:hypothetical protein
VRLANGLGEAGGEVVDTFVPGMVMTLDRNLKPGGAPDTVFRRLFAPIAAHTTQRQARSCVSCHNGPVALGLGKGELRFDPGPQVANRQGQWRFKPLRPALPQDGLPEDAWTGFLAARSDMVSTQPGARPFGVAEQQRILTVGACLTCHKVDSAVMRDTLRDFAVVFKRRSPQCAVPTWAGSGAARP